MYIKDGILTEVIDNMVIMSQCVGISKFNNACLKYVHILFINYKPIKVENINNTYDGKVDYIETHFSKCMVILITGLGSLVKKNL